MHPVSQLGRHPMHILKHGSQQHLLPSHKKQWQLHQIIINQDKFTKYELDAFNIPYITSRTSTRNSSLTRRRNSRLYSIRESRASIVKYGIVNLIYKVLRKRFYKNLCLSVSDSSSRSDSLVHESETATTESLICTLCESCDSFCTISASRQQQGNLGIMTAFFVALHHVVRIDLDTFYVNWYPDNPCCH